MIISHQILTPRELDLLASLHGDTWVDISSRGMFDRDLAWTEVRIETAKNAIALILQLEIADLYGEEDEYPHLHVKPANEKHPDSVREGTIYFQGRGEPINQIWILRETMSCTHNGQLNFKNTADTAISFQLATMNISFIRATHFSDVFLVQHALSKEEIELPDSLSEWEEDLLDQYELTREWIQVA
jgi:hypothetical protein